MRLDLRFAVVLAAAISSTAASAQQAAPLPTQPTSDYAIAIPVSGGWVYGPTATGSSATFRSPAGTPLLIMACTRSIRRVSISRPAAPPAVGAGASLSLWGAGQSRTLPAAYSAAAGQLTASLGAYDSMLDALAFSRGRIVVTPSTGAPLVAPMWPDIIRVIEDCRV